MWKNVRKITRTNSEIVGLTVKKVTQELNIPCDTINNDTIKIFLTSSKSFLSLLQVSNGFFDFLKMSLQDVLLR